MPKASRHGTPPRDNEAATLWADLGEGVRNYRRMKYNERIAFEIRQGQRRQEVEKINGAQIEDGTIAGYPWREAWMKVQVQLFIDGKFDEMEGPQEWKQRKLRNKPRNDG